MANVIRTVNLAAATTIYGRYEAGTRRVEMPADYSADGITWEDVLMDAALRLVEPGAGPYRVEETQDCGWTVIYDDGAEEHDLNAQGEPCATLGELRDFIRELHAQGAFDAEVRDALIEGL